MKVGVIGLGAMGGNVARNLAKKGFDVYVYDIRKEKMEELAHKGAKPVCSIRNLAQICDAAMLFLPMAPFDSSLQETICGIGGILENMKRGGVIVECGNTSPLLIGELSAEAKKRGVGFVDAPMSGGQQGAENGTLSVMAGGSKEDFEKVKDILASISCEINYFGEAGAGQTAKLVNNMLVNGQLALLSEVLVFAKKVGLDVEVLINTLSKGAAASWVLDTYGRGIINRPHKGYATPGGGFSGKKEGGRDKQLAWAIEMAEQVETPLPVTAAAYYMFMLSRGMGKKGLFEPIVDLLEDAAKVEVISEKKDGRNSIHSI